MNISNIKDLEKVIKLCRRLGVSTIKVDNVELQLTSLPSTGKVSTFRQIATNTEAFVPGGITEDMKIVTDELTEDQLLMWSAEAPQ